MYPAIPTDMTSGAVQVAVYLVAAIATFWGFLFQVRA
jgi:hypothetical protein